MDIRNHVQNVQNISMAEIGNHVLHVQDTSNADIWNQVKQDKQLVPNNFSYAIYRNSPKVDVEHLLLFIVILHIATIVHVCLF